MKIARKTAVVILSCLAALPAPAQTQSNADKSNTLAKAAQQGIPLAAALTVQGNVTVQAVLIPAPIATRVFGQEIAKNYAVIQLTIDNHSSDAALIVQGAFIDFHNWALNGLTADPSPNPTCGEGSETRQESSNQKCAEPGQVASEESRIARGELLNAQPFTKRNLVINGLALAGSIASAYVFAVGGSGFSKSIAAFNGTVVPGLGTFIPDGTVAQLNRISDFGYQTNKVISKQGSDIIVCFFPIDRFLTPTFKDLFLNKPAVFLSPYEALLDKSVRGDISPILPANVTVDILKAALPCYLEYKKEAAKEAKTKANAGAKAVADAKATVADKYSLDKARAKVQAAKDAEIAARIELGKSTTNVQAIIKSQRDAKIDLAVATAKAARPGKGQSAAKIELAKAAAKADADAETASSAKSDLADATAKVEAAAKNEAAAEDALTAAKEQDEMDKAIAAAEKSAEPNEAATATSAGSELMTSAQKKISDTCTPGNTPLTSDALLALNMLGSASLSHIRVVIDGVMTVDAGTIPATIDSVEFDDGSSNPTLWTTAGEKQGTIKGHYLTSGTPKIAEADHLGIAEVAAIADRSTDQALRFSMKLSKPIPVGQKLTFTVDKTDSKGDKKTVGGVSYVYVVGYISGAPEVTKVEFKDPKITVTGKGFVDSTLNPLGVTLHSSSGGRDVTVKPTSHTETEIDMDAPLALKQPGCWEVKITVGTMAAATGHDTFAVVPEPKISTASRVGKPATTVEVDGDGFADTSACGGSPLTFQLLKSQAGGTPVSVKAKIDSTQKVRFDLPAAAKSGSWSVQVLLGKDVKDTKPLK